MVSAVSSLCSSLDDWSPLHATSMPRYVFLVDGTGESHMYWRMMFYYPLMVHAPVRSLCEVVALAPSHYSSNTAPFD